MQQLSASSTPINVIETKLRLQNLVKSGGGWFYWIAGLSLVNSVVSLTGSTWNFILGLGITQIIDGIASAIAKDIPSVGTLAQIIGFALNLVIGGIFVLFGVLSTRKHKWAFIVGMIVYAFDGLIFLIFQLWLAFGFHIFALIGIFGGLRALGNLQKLEQSLAQSSVVE